MPTDAQRLSVPFIVGVVALNLILVGGFVWIVVSLDGWERLWALPLLGFLTTFTTKNRA